MLAFGLATSPRGCVLGAPARVTIPADRATGRMPVDHLSDDDTGSRRDKSFAEGRIATRQSLL